MRQGTIRSLRVRTKHEPKKQVLPQWPDDMGRKAIRLFKRGMNCGEIGRRLGKSRQSVQGFLSRRGYVKGQKSSLGPDIEPTQICPWPDDLWFEDAPSADRDKGSPGRPLGPVGL